MNPRVSAARVAPAMAVALCAWLAPSMVRAVELPADFVAESFVPGDLFVVPTGIAFLPDRRLLVAEKRGRVWVIKDGVRQPVPLWAHDSEVLDDGDRGLLGIAVDPHYFVNHYVYLLYTVDPDSNDVDTDGDAFGRLARYQVNFTDSNTVIESSRTILMGTTWRDGPLVGSVTHTIGSLRWGADGSLMVSVGDGAHFETTDDGGQDPTLFGPNLGDPYEDIGAFRSQFIGSLDGKVLRLNPANGHGYASNPFADGNLASTRSKVWAYGLRNPFRFTMRPGTGSPDTAQGRPGTVFLGDVGWSTWEEMDIARTGGKNFGWPCHEGFGTRPEYLAASPSHGGCDSVGSAWDPSPFSDPAASWNHLDAAQSVPPGFYGNTSIGGVFYTGALYPPQYQGRYFFGDYGANWLRSAVVDTSDAWTSIQDFGQALQGPVDFTTEPQTGDLVYVSILTGEIRRIRYGGGSPTSGPPVAVASATPDVGLAPLAVAFSSAGSFDPDGGPITTAWAFGDQQGSVLPNPSHTYTAPGTYSAVLTATDTTGAIGRDSVQVIVAAQIAFPSTPVLDDFNRANGPVGSSWSGPAFSVDANRLAPTAQDAWGVWTPTAFGPTQEVYVTLSTVSASAPEHDLMLKLQNTDWHAGYIEARYDVTVGTVAVTTYTGGTGWVPRGSWPMSFAAGDRFGARAYANGTIEVYKNGVMFGSCSAGNWPFTTSGGRIGVLTFDAQASRFDDFGGGDAVLDTNTKPHVVITSPLADAWFVEGDTIVLNRTVSDAQDPVDSLVARWDVNLRHNNHVHPDTYSSTLPSTSFVAGNHDDGTGTWYEVMCSVVDKGGLRDTAVVFLWPELNLRPQQLSVLPAQPGADSPMQVAFWLRNTGRMPAPISHWAITAGGLTLAQGDTLVWKQDSVRVVAVVPPTLSAGSYTLRATADTLHARRETDETDNAIEIPLTVVPGSVGVTAPPGRLALSAPRPNPTANRVAFTLDLPRGARVTFAVYDLQGREVWHEDPRERAAGRHELVWPGTARGGGRLGAGLYLARVTADGETFQRRIALLR